MQDDKFPSLKRTTIEVVEVRLVNITVDERVGIYMTFCCGSQADIIVEHLIPGSAWRSELEKWTRLEKEFLSFAHLANLCRHTECERCMFPIHYIRADVIKIFADDPSRREIFPARDLRKPG
jgi:hypothetical protein